MIRHMDNWSMYGGVTARLLDGVYAQGRNTGFVADPDGISSGLVFRLTAGTNALPGLLRFVLPENVTTCGQAVRFWLGELPSSEGQHPCPMTWKTPGNAPLYSLFIRPTGRICVVKGDVTSAIIIGETENPVVTAHAWWHVEGKVVQNGATSTLEVRVEGVTVINEEFDATGDLEISQVEFLNDPTNTSVGVTMYLKDFVVWDGTGTYNTDFIGSVLVVNLDPIADVDLNWTPSTGTEGYPILDNRPPVDTEFISAADPPPPAYVGELSDLPEDITSVKAIMTFVRAAKTDGGDASMQVGVISDPDGTPATVLGSNRPITVAQTYWRDVFETDPVTNAPWLPSAVNEAEIQIDRTL